MIEKKYGSRTEISPNRNGPLRKSLAAMSLNILQLIAIQENVKLKSRIYNTTVPCVPNENATSLKVTWQCSNIGRLDRQLR
jgi:hypothetical protein